MSVACGFHTSFIWSSLLVVLLSNISKTSFIAEVILALEGIFVGVSEAEGDQHQAEEGNEFHLILLNYYENWLCLRLSRAAETPSQALETQLVIQLVLVAEGSRLVFSSARG